MKPEDRNVSVRIVNTTSGKDAGSSEPKYTTVETAVNHKEATTLLKGKIVDKVTKVSCDEGLTVHFTDGTKLEIGYAGCEGQTAINNEVINVQGA